MKNKETLEEASVNFAHNYFEMHESNNYQALKLGFKEGTRWQAEQYDTSNVTRVEVIQHSEPYNGRSYTNYNAKDVEIQLQDNGKTLKIFLK